MAVSGTTVVRRQMGRRLRRLREQAGLTHDQVAETLKISRTTMYRLEGGQVECKVAMLRALCELYRVSGEERAALEVLQPGTKDRGWWQEYRDQVPEWFRMYIDLEGAADHICTWEDNVVPGEVQTADYSAAVFRAGYGDIDETAVARKLAVRANRQKALFSRAPRLTIVLGEGVLVRQVGGPEVMHQQLEHLRALDREDHIDIRVLPLASGAHAAMAGAFRLFDFVGEERTAYVESEVGGRYVEKEMEVSRYGSIFESLSRQSVPIGEHR